MPATRVVPWHVFGRQCTQVLEVAKVLGEVTALAGLEQQAAVLRQVQVELADVSQSEGVTCGNFVGDASAGTTSSLEDRQKHLAADKLDPQTAAIPPVPKSTNLHDLAGSIESLQAARVESKKNMDRLSLELQALCAQAERTGIEMSAARKEVQNALAEAGQARAVADGHEVRVRVVATEVQQLREHIAATSRRTGEDIESCSNRINAESTDLRKLIGDLASESRTLRQNIANMEHADRLRRVDGVSEEAVEEGIKRLERTIFQQLAEVKLWQDRTDIWKQGLVQSHEEAVASQQADVSKIRGQLEKVATNRQFGGCSQCASRIADGAADSAEDANHSSQMTTFQGIQDMPKTWRMALEDAVRRVQWLSDETRRQLWKRLEEHKSLVEDQLSTAEQQHSSRIEDNNSVSQEALTRADDVAANVKFLRDLVQQISEACSRRITVAASATAEELRAELKDAIHELSTEVQQSTKSHQLRLASLDEVCGTLEKEVVSRSDGLSKELENRFKEVVDITERHARSMEEQRAKLRFFSEPFRDEVERRFREVWSESGDIRSLVGQHERQVSEELGSVKSISQSRLDDLRGIIDNLSARLDREATEWADRADKTEVLKRNLAHEARSAVDERCTELGDFATKLRDTLLAEVREHLGRLGHDTTAMASKIDALDFQFADAQGASAARGKQFEAALNATERLASAARGDAEDAVRRSKKMESLIMALLQPELEVIASQCGNENGVIAAPPRPPPVGSVGNFYTGASVGGVGGSGAEVIEDQASFSSLASVGGAAAIMQGSPSSRPSGGAAEAIKQGSLYNYASGSLAIDDQASLCSGASGSAAKAAKHFKAHSSHSTCSDTKP